MPVLSAAPSSFSAGILFSFGTFETALATPLFFRAIPAPSIPRPLRPRVEVVRLIRPWIFCRCLSSASDIDRAIGYFGSFFR